MRGARSVEEGNREVRREHAGGCEKELRIFGCFVNPERVDNTPSVQSAIERNAARVNVDRMLARPARDEHPERTGAYDNNDGEERVAEIE